MRPVIIVTNNKANAFSPYVYVVPLTTREKKQMPTHVDFFMNNMQQTILCEDIIPVEREDFEAENFVQKADCKTMERVDHAIMIEFGLNGDSKV